jgi:hypothetical protein
MGKTAGGKVLIHIASLRRGLYQGYLSLRAKRSNPGSKLHFKVWIASSLRLLAMTQESWG